MIELLPNVRVLAAFLVLLLISSTTSLLAVDGVCGVSVLIHALIAFRTNENRGRCRAHLEYHVAVVDEIMAVKVRGVSAECGTSGFEIELPTKL